MEKLFVIIDLETKLIKKHNSKGTLAVFKSEAMAEKHSWRYVPTSSGYEIISYEAKEDNTF